MAVNAVVQDGAFVETLSQTASKTAKAEKSAPDGYDKDAFLQLLVAQMQYQDPLEPTSNTEYISQYATFSQVEQLQNMASTMDLSRASSYVGQNVEITSTNDKGEAKTVEGVVDYVKMENGKAFVSVGGELYPSDSITAVVDQTYNTAVELANTFADAMNKLPTLANLTLADEETIETLRSGFNSLNSYQQSFIDKSYVEMLDTYVNRMREMISDADEAAKAEAQQKNEEKMKEAEDAEEKVEEVALS